MVFTTRLPNATYLPGRPPKKVRKSLKKNHGGNHHWSSNNNKVGASFLRGETRYGSNVSVVKKTGNPHGEEKWEPRGNSSEAPIVVAARKVGLTENVSGGSQDPKDTVVIHHEIQRFLGGWFQTCFYLHPYLGKIPHFDYFSKGWHHQLEVFFEPKRQGRKKSLFWKDEKTKTFIQMDCFFFRCP